MTRFIVGHPDSDHQYPVIDTWTHSVIDTHSTFETAISVRNRLNSGQ